MEGPAQWIINARIALREIKLGPCTGELAAWGHNLTNNNDELFPLGFTFLAETDFQPARTFGVDLSLKY